MLKPKPVETSKVSNVLDKVLTRMETTPPQSEEFADLAEIVVNLHPLTEADRPKGVTPDTKALIGAQLVMVFAILFYEHGHVITSKALGILPRLPIGRKP